MATVAGSEHVVLTTDAGVLVVDLYEDDAPKHVNNFRKLVSEGYYNGKTFTRAVEGFLAQAGELPDGVAASKIPPEIKRQHVKGALAMAVDAENSPEFDYYDYVKQVDHRNGGAR